VVVSKWVPHGALVVAATAAVATGMAVTSSVPVWVALTAPGAAVLAALAGRRVPRAGPALAVLGGAAALDVLVGTVLLPDRWGTGLLVLVLAAGLPWLLGRSFGQQVELAATAAERARLQERARIAREMHDSLGHELALVALRAGALELAADLPAHHREAATGLRAAAGRATERLATVVAVLRDGAPAPLEPPAERIEEMLERASRAGVRAALDWPEPRELPAAVDRAAYRVVQEGLTNAVKHAPGSPVTVRLSTGRGATAVEVSNPVPTSRPDATGSGAGLAGLAERLRPLGGSVRSGTGIVAGDRVYRLAATLPHPAAAP
jgi:signal transduction histidine kinase